MGLKPDMQTVAWYQNFIHPLYNGCCTDGTQQERNYLVANAPMPRSPIQLLTKLSVA